jgi:hypothetical protein
MHSTLKLESNRNNLVEWAIASHGMYESALVFSNLILKQKNLYIVNYVQSDSGGRKYAVMSQISHCTQLTMYKFFCFKFKIKTKADSYMPCKVIAHQVDFDSKWNKGIDVFTRMSFVDSS